MPLEFSMSSGKLGHLLQSGWGQFAANAGYRRIVRGASIVGILSLAVATATAVRDLVIAAWFGTGDVVDAFLIAFLLPNFVMFVLAGSFAAAVIPTYLQIRVMEGDDASRSAFSQVMFLGLVLLGVVSILAVLLGPALLAVIASGFGPEKLDLTRQLYYAFVPLIVIGGLATMFCAALNANEHFAPAAFAPALVPLTALLALLALGSVWGIYALALGVILGFGLQLLVVVMALRKRALPAMPRWRGWDPSTRTMVDQYVPMVIGVAALGGTLFVDQAMAASLGAGSVAALAYGNKLAALMVVLGVGVAKTAVFPHFARAVAAQAWREIWTSLRVFTLLILAVTVPLTALLFIFSTPIAQLLFERGAFQSQDTALVGRIQAAYVLQIPFQVLANLLSTLLSSLRANHMLMRVWVTSLVLNVILNYLFMSLLGVTGIALASTVVYAVICAWFAVLVYRAIHPRLGHGDGS
jgi:putative peptidoglycan lipid II flippase